MSDNSTLPSSDPKDYIGKTLIFNRPPTYLISMKNSQSKRAKKGDLFTIIEYDSFNNYLICNFKEGKAIWSKGLLDKTIRNKILFVLEGSTSTDHEGQIYNPYTESWNFL